jgi:GWxTD domain-containing protein
MRKLPSKTAPCLHGILITSLAVLAACAGQTASPANRPTPRPAGAPASRPPGAGPEFDATRLYTQMGFLAATAPMPFIGAVSYAATTSPDSTEMTIGLSLANAALSFTRDNDRFVAGYTAGITIRQGSTVVRDIDAHETVRVAAYKETGRIDESVVFQQGVLLAPGQYALAVSVRDDGSGRTNTQETTIIVPRLGAAGALSTPVPFLRVTPRHSRAAVTELIRNPRATAVFGRDTAVALYVEGYGQGELLPVGLEVRSDEGRVLWRAQTTLPRNGDLFSGVVWIPVNKIGIGVAVVAMWPPAATDTARAPVFITFGEGLPVAKFDDMLVYLRWFAAPYRLKTLRDTTPEARPGAWTAFVKATDSNPLTSMNEDLVDYFTRLLVVTQRFREEGVPGWLTDRGRVFLGLGEPDQVYDQGLRGFGDRGRSQVWEYRGQNAQLVFYDQTGFGRWKLTNASEMEFMNQWQRKVNR